MAKAKNKAGAKNKYESHIKPKLKEIEEMLKKGASEKQVAESLGVSYASFNNYKRDFEELKEICDKPRVQLISDLRSALIKKALGFEYEEKKSYKKIDNDGKEYSYIEVTKKQSLPDVAAINLALKNYDKDNWANDPQHLEIKKLELELKKELAENKDW